MTRVLRILAATTAGAGHFAPMVPFAAALRDAGHVVRVAAPASVALAVQRAGFEHVPLADAPPEEIGPIAERLPQLAREDANAVVVREVFCGIGARAALPGMQAVVEEWRPDVILRETAEFASYVVAARAGIPHVDVAMSLASVEAFMHAQVDEALSALGSPSGVAGLAAAPRLTLVPASLEDPSERVLPDIGLVRLVDPETGETLDVDTSDPAVRSQFDLNVNADADRRRHLLRRLAIDEIPVNTDRGIMEPLLRFFRARETRLRK